MQHTRKHSTVSIFLKTYVSHHARLFVVLKESYSNRNWYGRAPLPGLESERDNDKKYLPFTHTISPTVQQVKQTTYRFRSR